MSFDTSNGTRGARRPTGRFLQFFNKLAMRKVRRGGGSGPGGLSRLILITVGRKSGLERQSPVAWFPGDGGTRLIVASAGGAATNPSWYYNLSGHPDRVRIQIGDQVIRVTATQLHGAEREAAWRKVVATAPSFGQYQKKTDRELPLIRLTDHP